jgi:hypothetical protein
MRGVAWRVGMRWQRGSGHRGWGWRRGLVFVARLDRRAAMEAGEHCGVPAMPEEVDERCSHLRRGWYGGGTAGFAQKMLGMAASAVRGRKSRAYARSLEVRAHGT